MKILKRNKNVIQHGKKNKRNPELSQILDIRYNIKTIIIVKLEMSKRTREKWNT